MSAFLVNDETINLIVSFAHINRERIYIKYPQGHKERAADQYGYLVFEPTAAADCEAMAQILLDENYRSLNARYGDPDEAHKIKFKDARKLFHRIEDIVAVIKCCHCLAYQSCESDDWEDTLAFKILERIKDRAVRKLLNKNGYDEAPWGL